MQNGTSEPVPGSPSQTEATLRGQINDSQPEGHDTPPPPPGDTESHTGRGRYTGVSGQSIGTLCFPTEPLPHIPSFPFHTIGLPGPKGQQHAIAVKL